MVVSKSPFTGKDSLVANSTVSPALVATPELQELLALLGPQLQELCELVQDFRRQPPTPERTFAYEKKVAAILRTTGRVLLETEYNRIEPERIQDCPFRFRWAGQEYRRRPKSRKEIATLFGEITLRRYLYEPTEAGERCIFPLQMQLGVEAGLATPALAERVGLWSAEHEQEQVRSLLRQEHDVHWSVKSLRKLALSLRDGLASFREEAQVAKILELLEKADCSKGQHRPVLAAGRDGIHVPIRDQGYHEGATATVSVMDRRGRRLGTVYLGQMPESCQIQLSADLTSLLTKVLSLWHARGKRAPRLAYVTDAGNHPKEYAKRVLRHMADPWRPGQKLAWEWIVDYWHGCGYVSDLAESLFGAGARSHSWFRKWRHWLRDRHQGVAQVLRSAMWHYNNGRQLSKAREEAYWKAYGYLRKHAVWMKYAHYKKQGLPIGSGVTEAACKTVFAERLKRSGMTWGIAGGQLIVDLRILVLSQVWQAAHQAYLATQPLPTPVKTASHRVERHENLKKAA
jgi:hypothetical protein